MDAQVAILLQLKAEYKKLTGEDPPGATSQSKKDKTAKPKAEDTGR